MLEPILGLTGATGTPTIGFIIAVSQLLRHNKKLLTVLAVLVIAATALFIALNKRLKMRKLPTKFIQRGIIINRSLITRCMCWLSLHIVNFGFNY